MFLSINAFATTLFLSGLVSMLISICVWSRVVGSIRWFTHMLFCIALWAITYGLELACTSLEQMLFWIHFEYVGIALLPATWFCFIVSFIGKHQWLTRRNLAALFSIPVITMVLVWTNSLHHLHYKSVSLDVAGDYRLLAIERGPWYYFFTGYFYVLLAAGTILLQNRFRHADRIYRQQNWIILLSAFIPWFVNLLYLLGFRPYKHIDLTPYAFIITSSLLAIGLLRFRLLNLIPIARDKIIEGMHSGMMVLDVQDFVIDANSEMRRILQRESKIVGEHFQALLGGEAQLNEHVSNRTQAKVQFQLLDRWYEVGITPLFEHQTVHTGLILLFTDITDHRAVEQKLAQQTRDLQALNRTKSRLLSVIAHDLRGPMSGLVELMNFMEDGSLSQADFKAQLPLLSRNVNGTYALLENLLLWSKSQFEGERLTVESFNLAQLVHDGLDVWQQQAHRKGITLQSNIPEGIHVLADREMIRIVLRNLVSNAIKFTPAKGLVTISATHSGDHVRVKVTDTGVGMSAQDQKLVLGQDYYTTKGTAGETGTGLGLMLCKEYVEKNQGQLWVESELGHGSSFFFSLPR